MDKEKPPAAERHRHPALMIPRKDAEAKLDARINAAKEVQSLVDGPGGAEATRALHAWHNYNFEMLRRMFTDASVADSYQHIAPARVTASDWNTIFADEDLRDDLRKSLHARLARLREIRDQLELMDEPVRAVAAPRAASPAGQRAAFVVHGHDQAASQEVARVLTALGVKPIILHEQANRGRTILEKFESHADVPFAVVLLTPDDVGSEVGGQQRPRARQNVVLELGFFWGKLGRARVCVLYKGGVELPSDLHGLAYVPMDGAGGWRLKLAEELDAAGIEIDLNLLRQKR